MEIPMELMVTVSKDLPWMFHPDIVPLGHPIFDVINSTNVEVCLMPTHLNLATLFCQMSELGVRFWPESL
jgi:hypothetical protein